MTVGKGNPSAWQCNATVCPATTLVSLGSISHSGGTEIIQTHHIIFTWFFINIPMKMYLRISNVFSVFLITALFRGKLSIYYQFLKKNFSRIHIFNVMQHRDNVFDVSDNCFLLCVKVYYAKCKYNTELQFTKYNIYFKIYKEKQWGLFLEKKIHFEKKS